MQSISSTTCQQTNRYMEYQLTTASLPADKHTNRFTLYQLPQMPIDVSAHPTAQLTNRQTDLQSLNSPTCKQTNRRIDWQSTNSPDKQTNRLEEYKLTRLQTDKQIGRVKTHQLANSSSKVSRELEEHEGLQWGKPGPGGAYWRSSAITGQGFFDKMGWWVKWILL